MAAAAILKIYFNGYKSVALSHIYIKFGSERKTDVPETKIPSNFTSVKIQDDTKMATALQPMDDIFSSQIYYLNLIKNTKYLCYKNSLFFNRLLSRGRFLKKELWER